MGSDKENEQTVILQPGSHSLKIGLASFEGKPCVIPHVVARRCLRRHPKAALLADAISRDYKEICLPSPSGRQEDPRPNKVKHHFRLVPGPALLPAAGGALLLGHEVLQAPDLEHYIVRWPIRHGRLYEEAYTSNEELSADLEALWSHSFKVALGVPPAALVSYRVILLVPDLFRVADLITMVDVLLTRLRMMACIVIQESVAASYWVGTPALCVVDVGYLKSAVCCVSEGVSLPKSRIHLNYAGFELSKLLFQRLKLRGLFRDARKCDWVFLLKLLEDIKQAISRFHSEPLPQDADTPVTEIPSRICRDPVAFSGDVMSLIEGTMKEFFSISFNSQKGAELSHSFSYWSGHLYEDYLFNRSDIGSKFKRPTKPPQVGGESVAASSRGDLQKNGGGVACAKVDAGAAPATAAFPGEPTTDKESSTQNENSQGGADPSSSGAPTETTAVDDINATESGEVEEFSPLQVPPLLCLHHAVHHSVLSCESDEIRRQCYANVVLTGEGLLLECHREHLKTLLEESLSHFTTQYYEVCVWSVVKGVQSSYVPWMGGVVLNELDLDDNLWISLPDWLNSGPRLLRERCLFQLANFVKI